MADREEIEAVAFAIAQEEARQRGLKPIGKPGWLTPTETAKAKVAISALDAHRSQDKE